WGAKHSAPAEGSYVLAFGANMGASDRIAEHTASSLPVACVSVRRTNVAKCCAGSPSFVAAAVSDKMEGPLTPRTSCSLLQSTARLKGLADAAIVPLSAYLARSAM